MPRNSTDGNSKNKSTQSNKETREYSVPIQDTPRAVIYGGIGYGYNVVFTEQGY